MPIHNFVCDACGTIVQDTDTTGTHWCPRCNKAMRWDLRVAIHGNYKTPIHSDSLAITPSQIAEHKKLFPNIELDGDCRPIFNNFVDHENYLKATGFVKAPKKIKLKGKRIA